MTEYPLIKRIRTDTTIDLSKILPRRVTRVRGTFFSNNFTSYKLCTPDPDAYEHLTHLSQILGFRCGLRSEFDTIRCAISEHDKCRHATPLECFKCSRNGAAHAKYNVSLNIVSCQTVRICGTTSLACSILSVSKPLSYPICDSYN